MAWLQRINAADCSGRGMEPILPCRRWKRQPRAVKATAVMLAKAQGRLLAYQGPDHAQPQPQRQLGASRIGADAVDQRQFHSSAPLGEPQSNVAHAMDERV